MKKLTAIILPALIIFILASCSGKVTKYDVDTYTAVEITHVKGKTFRGVVVGHSGEKLEMVLEKNHKAYKIPVDEIANIREIDLIYDNYARPISDKEISSNKSYWRTTVSGVLGAVVGGAVGFFIGEQGKEGEVEVASTGTYVGAAVGAGIGIMLGLNADENKAIAKTRTERDNNPPKDLKDEKSSEEEKIRKIEEEKKRLQEQLKKKND